LKGIDGRSGAGVSESFPFTAKIADQMTFFVDPIWIAVANRFGARLLVIPFPGVSAAGIHLIGSHDRHLFASTGVPFGIRLTVFLNEVINVLIAADAAPGERT
jgi:hypothetical protein